MTRCEKRVFLRPGDCGYRIDEVNAVAVLVVVGAHEFLLVFRDIG